MSDKEYKIEFNSDDSITIREVIDDYDYTPSTDPTGRENMGSKFRSMSIAAKIVLVLLFDIYGILYRIGSNSTWSVYVGVAQIFTLNFFGILWIVDFISIIIKNDIVVCGMKYYRGKYSKK